ncbi:MAG: tetratricopeptide repeat protein, partial [Myxococcota bacterium]
EDVEEFVAEQAEAAATFLEKHQKSIVGGMVAIAACAALLWGYQKYNEGNASESSAALWDAVQTANALIVEEDDVSELEEELERYETVEARADQALEEFREVRTRFPGSVAAAYAALGEGNALYDKGDYDGAREAYEAAMAEGGNRGDIAVRALEGIAFTHEAQDAWDSAGENYSRLADVEASSASALSGLHLARVALHGGDEEDAKEHLRTVLEALREEDAPDLPYVRDQAELRLMAIDSSLVQRSPELNMPGGGDLSPEQMERIRQMLQQQQQQTP